MATRLITSLVCDLHDGDQAAAVPVWFGIDGQLYQIDACPGCAARVRDVLGPLLTRARRAGVMAGYLPRPDGPPRPTVQGPTPKRDLVLGAVRARIADGNYPPGSYLPTLRDIAAEHGMSVTPVASACWELERQGLLRRAAGGRYIIQPEASGGQQRRHGDGTAG